MVCKMWGATPHSPVPASPEKQRELKTISQRDQLSDSQTWLLVKSTAKYKGARQLRKTEIISQMFTFPQCQSFHGVFPTAVIPTSRGPAGPWKGFGMRRPGSCTRWWCNLHQVLGRAISWNQRAALVNGTIRMSCSPWHYEFPTAQGRLKGQFCAAIGITKRRTFPFSPSFNSP